MRWEPKTSAGLLPSAAAENCQGVLLLREGREEEEEEEEEEEKGSLPMARGAERSQVGNGRKRRAGWRYPVSTSTSKRRRNTPQPWGLFLELSNAHYLKRESSPQNPVPDPLLTRRPGWPVGSSKQGWDAVGVLAHSPAPGGSCQHLYGKTPVSLLLSLRNIPKISSLLRQPSKVRTWGRTTRTRRGWLGKQQVPKSKAGSSIPFGALPECENRNAHMHLG